MDKAPARPGLCLGWVCWFFWPVGAAVLIFLVGRFVLDNEALGLFALLLLYTAGCIPVLYAVAALIAWVSRLFATPHPYGCPVCGHDIRDNPHCCRHCGTRLVWGELPEPNPHACRFAALRLTKGNWPAIAR